MKTIKFVGLRKTEMYQPGADNEVRQSSTEKDI